MQLTRLLVVALLPLLTAVTALQAQTTLRIFVADATSNSPVSSAVVSVARPSGAVLRIETDSAGNATFPNLGGGSHTITVQAIGYEASAPRQLTLEAGTYTDLDISLKPAPIGLQAVQATVTAAPARAPDLASNGFYDRMKFNNGIFVDQAEIEKRNQRLLSDLIRSKPGINLRPGPGGEQYMWFRGNEGLSMGSGGVALCGPAIFLDGIMVHQSSKQPSPVDGFVKTHDLAGIEIYRRPSQIPQQYGGATSGCGVVLLWTRVRS